MQAFMTILLACSVSMSMISLIWIGLLPILSKRYEAKWLYGICLLLMLGWLIPFRPVVGLSFMAVPFSADTIDQVQPVLQHTGQALPMLPAGEPVGSSPSTAGIIWKGISAIWLAGVILYVAAHGWRHWRLTQAIRRWSEPIAEARVVEAAERLKKEMNIRRPIDLRACTSLASPMLMGLWRPTIVLPSEQIAEDELMLILKHELIHFKRHDLWAKAGVLLATALHWFNPVVYLMARATAAQCEVSCDARVLRDSDFQQRKRYGATIIHMARKQAVPQAALTTLLYGGKRGMKTRLWSILDTRKKKAGVLLSGMVLIAVVGAGAVFAAQAAETSPEKNQTFDEPEKQEVIGPLTVRQEIPVAWAALQVDEYAAVAGPFVLQEGDMIQYDLQAEGNGHLNADLRKTNEPGDERGYLGAAGMTGNRFTDAGSFRVTTHLAGTYYLWIGNFDGKSLDPDNSGGLLENIQGTVRIVVDEGAKRKPTPEPLSETKGAPAQGGSIATQDGQHLSVSAFRRYTNFAKVPFQKGETFTLSVIGEEALDVEVGLLLISTDAEFGGRVNAAGGEVNITIPADGEYRIYMRNHAEEPANFELHLSKVIEGPLV